MIIDLGAITLLFEMRRRSTRLGPGENRSSRALRERTPARLSEILAVNKSVISPLHIKLDSLGCIMVHPDLVVRSKIFPTPTWSASYTADTDDEILACNSELSSG
jgi:hypothetical protein